VVDGLVRLQQNCCGRPVATSAPRMSGATNGRWQTWRNIRSARFFAGGDKAARGSYRCCRGGRLTGGSALPGSRKGVPDVVRAFKHHRSAMRSAAAFTDPPLLVDLPGWTKQNRRWSAGSIGGVL